MGRQFPASHPGPMEKDWDLTGLHGRRTYLVDHIYEALCVFRREATYHVTRILTHEDNLNQGGGSMRSELAFD